MSAVIRWLTQRRFSVLDLIFAVQLNTELNAQRWWAALVVIGVWLAAGATLRATA